MACLFKVKKKKTSVGGVKHHGLVRMLDLMFRENAWGRFLKGEYFMQEGLLNRCCVFEAFAFVGHISVLFLVLGWGRRYGMGC